MYEVRFPLQQFARITTIVLVLLSCLVVGVFYVVTTREIEEVYAADTKEAIYSLKQDFLKDSVNNQINRIIQRRKLEVDRYRGIVEKTDQTLQTLVESSSSEQFIQFFENHFSLQTSNGLWSAMLWDTTNGEILVDSEGMCTNGGPPEIVLEGEVESFSAYKITEYGTFGSFFGIRMERIDELVKQAIADEIHNSTFAEDSYIWINEIKNYDGGEGYAVRRVHPNLIDTEGMLLSTSMTDIAGNLPYLEELEGIKEHGELFFTYFFKRKDSERIAEKLTYAKLYEPYDWVVAMGSHLEDIEGYVEHANTHSASVVNRLLPLFALVLVVLVSLGFVLLIVHGKWQAVRSRRALEEAAHRDILTNAFNRRMGLSDLGRLFNLFSKGVRQSPVLILFDIDDFKLVNDVKGHSEGDAVLSMVVSTMTSIIRTSDRLYRWGGDEFLVVCNDILPRNSEVFTNSLLSRFSALYSEVTISLGVSYFHREDKSCLDSLKRAYEALYRAKKHGKNRVELNFI